MPLRADHVAGGLLDHCGAQLAIRRLHDLDATVVVALRQAEEPRRSVGKDGHSGPVILPE
ncbi:hypothetical protein [Nocardia sp. NPDC005745]|uniref:hypothetical protein n=1 Tax=Nocardia sp. NPDC005745 TaxID=3157061 RepID=UPI0033DED10C